MKILKSILQVLWNSFKAIFEGEFLLRLRIDRYFLHILYTFLLILVIIFIRMGAENTLATVEVNKTELEGLRIYHSQKKSQLVEMNRLSTIENMLKEKGSEVGVPEKPATRIEK
jgi:hypothetical protein